jgi:hypothetical protein
VVSIHFFHSLVKNQQTTNLTKLLLTPWKAVNKVNYYIFTCLPVGLISACYIFTKVVRPLDTFWRSKGFLIVVYLDNGLGFEDSEESCFEIVKEKRHAYLDDDTRVSTQI